MTPEQRKERVIELGKLIVSTRNRLQELEIELNQLLGTFSSPSTHAPDSVSARIIYVLNGNPTAQFRAEHVAAFTRARLDTTRSTLARLADSRQIVRTGRGLYQAKV